MQAMDSINQKYGRRTVHSAASGGIILERVHGLCGEIKNLHLGQLDGAISPI